MKKIIISSNFKNHKNKLLNILSDFSNSGYVLGNQQRNEIRVVSFEQKDLNIKSFKKTWIY